MAEMFFNNGAFTSDYLEDVRLVRHALAGDRTVKRQGELYWPRPEGMTPTAYAAYRNRGLYFNLPKLTLQSLEGRVFRKPVLFENVPEKLLERPATLDGQSLEWLAREAF